MHGSMMSCVSTKVEANTNKYDTFRKYGFKLFQLNPLSPVTLANRLKSSFEPRV